MATADVEEARKCAAEYMKRIEPRWQALAGRNASITYSVELMREAMGVVVGPEGTMVSYIPAVWLVGRAVSCPYAFQLLAELQGFGEDLIGSGADTIKQADVKRPKVQGNREQNGVRDLILAVLWVKLQAFGLPKENKVRKGVRTITPSIGVLISEVIQQIIGVKIEPATIRGAVLKMTKN